MQRLVRSGVDLPDADGPEPFGQPDPANRPIEVRTLRVHAPRHVTATVPCKRSLIVGIDSVFRLCAYLSSRQTRGAALTEFTRNPSRFDPYKNFKFRIRWEGRYVAGVDKASPLTRPATVGRRKFEAITLERGVTHDVEFERWASTARNVSKDSRRDVVIEVHDEAGRLTVAYKVFRCWVSEFQSLPDVDANANAVTIQHIKLEHEGIERDDEVPEPGRTR